MKEILSAHGCEVSRAFQEIWMTADDVRRLVADGHTIGLHSHTHPYAMGDLPRRCQSQEYGTNHARLTQLCGSPPVSMAHPLNSYGPDTLRILADLGIRCGFRANRVALSPGLCPPPALEWPREDAAALRAAVGRPA